MVAEEELRVETDVIVEEDVRVERGCGSGSERKFGD